MRSVRSRSTSGEAAPSWRFLVGAFGLVLALTTLPVVVAAVASTSRDARRWFDARETGAVSPMASAGRVLALLTAGGCLLTALGLALTDTVQTGYAAVGSTLVPRAVLTSVLPVLWVLAGLVLVLVAVRLPRAGAVWTSLGTIVLVGWVVDALTTFEVVQMPSIVLALATIVVLWTAEGTRTSVRRA